MQGIAYLLPVDGEIVVGAEMAITKHLGTDVADFHIHAEFVLERFCDGFQQQGKCLVLIHVVIVFSFTVDASLREQIGWNP